MNLPYAENINYWKTGKSSPDVWLERAARQIEGLGGHVLTHAFGQDPSMGTSAYLMQFEIKNDQYKLVWPVLPVENDTPKNREAAKRQAATLLYHDVKAKTLVATVKGTRRAFFEYLVLPDGRTTPDLAVDELLQLPRILEGFGVPQIED